MALKSTASESGQFNHIVGVVKGEKVLMNPTLKELHEYGATWYKTEPEYVGTNNNGDVQYIVDFFFKIEPFTYNGKMIEEDKEIRNVRFYLSPVERVSQAGNNQYVNKLGKFGWENASNWGKFDQTGMRKAIDGEELLYKFVRNFGDFRATDELQLSIDKISKGDFSELKDFVKESPNRKFKCLLGLSYNEEKNRFNSVVYGREFWRSWTENISVPDGNGGWADLDFKEGIPVLLDQDYMDFKKSVLHPGEAMILSNNDVQNMADLPDSSEETNANAGGDGSDPEDLPF